jgi:APA family basic amino acid/polyamine antiporter
VGTQPVSTLKRSLGLFPVTSIVIANMVGAGIFTTSGLLMQGLNAPFVLILLWLAGGIIALCGALSYSELGAAMPEAGGEYVFLSRLFHPMLGFLSGWVSFIVGFSAPIAASAMGVSEYLARANPSMFEWQIPVSFLAMVTPGKLLSVMVILLFAGIHLMGIKTGARIQNVLTLLKIFMILALIILGFSGGRGDMAHFREGSATLAGFAGLKTIGLSVMWIMFAYSGWNAATYIGSEVRDPARNLPAALLLGTGIVMVLYLCINMLYVYAVEPAAMRGVISIGGMAAGRLFGRPVETTFSVLIAFALFSSLSAYMILGPRVYFSMARQGLFFRALSRVNPSNHAPSNAILLQALFSIIMVVSGTFDQILTYMGFALGIFPIICVAGVFRQRKTMPGNLRMPGFPVAPGIFIMAGLAMLVLSWLERPAESSIAIATVVAGIPAYYIFRRYGRQSS